MTQSPNKGGQGNNQSSKGAAAAAPIVQPGEDAGQVQALAQAQQPAQGAPLPGGLEGFIADSGTENSLAAAPLKDEALIPGSTTAKEMTIAEMQAFMAQMAQNMATLTQVVMAQNRPVNRRQDVDQFSEVPRQTLEMPVDGALDDMRRPDKRQEQVDIDVVRDMDHAAMLKFLDEMVCINIAETGEEGAENPVVLGINGRQVAILRGQDTWLRRCYVELLLRAKPESIKTRLTRNGEGDVKNHIDKTRSLKYPFQLVQDRNPRGLAWARKIRSEA